MTLTPDLINPLLPTSAPLHPEQNKSPASAGLPRLRFFPPQMACFWRGSAGYYYYIWKLLRAVKFLQNAQLSLFLQILSLTKNCSIPKEIQCCFCGWLFFWSFHAWQSAGPFSPAKATLGVESPPPQCHGCPPWSPVYQQLGVAWGSAHGQCLATLNVRKQTSVF